MAIFTMYAFVFITTIVSGLSFANPISDYRVDVAVRSTEIIQAIVSSDDSAETVEVVSSTTVTDLEESACDQSEKGACRDAAEEDGVQNNLRSSEDVEREESSGSVEDGQINSDIAHEVVKRDVSKELEERSEGTLISSESNEESLKEGSEEVDKESNSDEISNQVETDIA